MRTTFATLLAGILILSGCNKEATSQSTTATSFDPNTMCLVSGEKLGSMGDPHVIEHEGKQIKLCCTACESDFRNDPPKYLAKLGKAPTSGPTTAPN